MSRPCSWITGLAVLSLAFSAGCGDPAENRLAKRKLVIDLNSSDSNDTSGPPATPPAPANNPAPANPAAGAPAPAAAPTAATPTAAETVAAAAAAVLGTGKVDPKDVPLILPSNLDEWTVEHIKGARVSADPNLPTALVVYARRHQDDLGAATLLVNLLQDAESLNQRGFAENIPLPKPLPLPDGRPGVLSRVVIPLPQLVPTLVEGLAIVGTSVADDTFPRLLQGYMRTDLDEASTARVVLESLIKVGGDSYEKLAVTCLTQPEQFRERKENIATLDKNSPQRLSAEDLQEMALISVNRSTSALFRDRLAKSLPSAKLTPGQKQRILGMFLVNRTENFPALVTLFASGKVGEGEKARIIGQLARGSAQAVQNMLDIPPSMQSGIWFGLPGDNDQGAFAAIEDRGENAPTESAMGSAEQARLLASQIWKESLAKALEQRISASNDKREANVLLTLAGLMPANLTRDSALRYWERNRIDGRKAVGRLENLLDPGLLPVMKLMPHHREDFKLNQQGARPFTAPEFDLTRAGTGPKAAQMEEFIIRVEWSYAIEDLLRLWLRRCQAAATAQKEAGVAASANVGDWEIALPENGKLQLEYVAYLNPQMGSSVISPTRLRYRKFEIVDTAEKLHQKFKQNLKGAVSRPVEEGRWIDFFEVRKGAGTVRSVDVLLRTKSFEQQGRRSKAERMTFDVLQIEIQNPSPGSDS